MNRMHGMLLVTTLAVTSAVAQTNVTQDAAGAAARPDLSRYEEGLEYRELRNRNRAADGRRDVKLVEVVEVFQYSCIHCWMFEEALQEWMASKPSYVSFVRVPAVWSPVAEIQGRAYYVADALGKTAEMHRALFQEIHEKRNALDTIESIKSFFERFGVPVDVFEATSRSDAVLRNVELARQFVQESSVTGTPAIVINGRWVTMNANYDRWFELVDLLIEAERMPN